jgi:hypothetical protein
VDADIGDVIDSSQQPCKRRDESMKGLAVVPEEGSKPTGSSESVCTVDADIGDVIDSSQQPFKRRDDSMKEATTVPEGGPEYIAGAEYVDCMETDVSFLKDTDKPQYRQALYSGRRRGRPRGRRSRGIGRGNSAQRDLIRARELKQSSEDNSVVEV